VGSAAWDAGSSVLPGVKEPKLPLELLAKSPAGNRVLGLASHCMDTEAAALAIFRGRTLASWRRFFRLGDEVAFLRDLRVACLMHDLGKANEDFQQAVRGFGRSQSIRHEHLSALVLCTPAVEQWVRSAGCDFDAVVAAVLSHHAKASPLKDDEFYWAVKLGRPAIKTFLRHTECRTILDRIAAVLGKPYPAELPDAPWPSPTWDAAWDRGMDQADALELPSESEFCPRRNHLLAVKAATVAADALASALWRERRDQDDFLAASLHRARITGLDIRNKVIQPRIEQLRRANRWQDWSDFQRAADVVGNRVVLIAGCGAGKTMFAWRWAASVADKTEVGAVVFLYPTRATATEGFKDYVAWAPETEAALLTGTASIDLAGLTRNPVEATRGKNYEDETDARLFALANWKRTYFSATLDQFLSFLEHGYTGLCLLPQLADSALIVDEVHSLDEGLFRRLVALLTHFGGPVLLMSATMPTERLTALRKLGIRVFPDAGEQVSFAELHEETTRARYRMLRVAERASAIEWFHISERRAPSPTLWVVNTVKRCQDLARTLRRLGHHPIVYHSRFRARDRRMKHETVVEAFRPKSAPRVAVTTQVCEMSLDLDADRLVSEDAPLTALIQRLGRSNRSRYRPTEFRAEVVTYPPEDASPYGHEEGGREAVAAAGRFAQDHNGRELGQSDLAAALANPAYVSQLPTPQPTAGFLSGGWFAMARPLRGQEDDQDVRCVLHTDLALGLCPEGMPGVEEPLAAWVLQVPRRMVLSIGKRGTPAQFNRPSWLADAGLHVADGTKYDADLGFLLIDPN
jgi:CRISPR-associated endonuclease/helicase Cas3